MQPKLIIISGPLRGSVFDLSEDEITVGREAACHVRLADASVSRRHSLLKREGDRFKILDALHEAGGNYVAAARLLGIHPNNLHRLWRNPKPKPASSR